MLFIRNPIPLRVTTLPPGLQSALTGATKVTEQQLKLPQPQKLKSERENQRNSYGLCRVHKVNTRRSLI
jgi:hypothetical protein